MPRRRSPPTISPGAVAGVAVNTASALAIDCPPQICDSDTASERSGSGTIGGRLKRRRERDDDIMELKTELSGLITSLSAVVEQRFSEIKKQNSELQISLQFMSDKYDTILQTLANLEEEKVKDKKMISKLEERIELLERKSRSTVIEIRNVPVELCGEKKLKLRSTFVKQ